MNRAALGSFLVLWLLSGFDLLGGQPQADVKPRHLQKPIRPSQAMDIPRLNSKERLGRNEYALVAKCRESKAARGPGGNIFTFVTFDVLQQLKGPARKTVALRYFGGQVGGDSVMGALDSNFQAGVKYFLMLGKENSDGYLTLDPGGVHVIQSDPDSKRLVVVPGLDGVPAFEAATGRRYPAAAEWMFLDDFLFTLRKAQ